MVRKENKSFMKRDMEHLIASGKLEKKSLYCMGSLPNAADMNAILNAYGLSLVSIVDNNPEKIGTHRMDGEYYRIIGPVEFFENRDVDTVMIIYSVRFWREMADQMIRNGFVEGKDLFILDTPTLERRASYIKKGELLRRELRKKYGEDVRIFVFHGPLGDEYMFALFFRQYLEKEGISNYVCLGNGTMSKIAELYELSPYREIDREDLLSLEYLWMFLGEEASDIKILQIWEFAFHDNRCRIRFDRRFTFIDTYRSYVYGLPERSTPQLPQFKNNLEKIRNLFRKLGLSPGKTAIIAPYAYSIESHPREIFWLEICRRLRESGYTIAVNIDAEREKNFIPNTAVIHFSIDESVPVLEYAGTFIGMRSGFCDVVSSAQCKKVALYPKMDLFTIDYDRHRTDLEFSSFIRMGLSDDFYEFEFEDRDGDEYWKNFAADILRKILTENDTTDKEETNGRDL